MDQVEEDLRKLNIGNWNPKTKNMKERSMLLEKLNPSKVVERMMMTPQVRLVIQGHSSHRKTYKTSRRTVLLNGRP